jgi:hypothetical protein
MAKAMWQEMKELWDLPDMTPWANYGKEWILALLDGRSELERTRILMTLWRIWHNRNEIVHNKPAPSIESSKRYLCSYVDSLMTVKYCSPADDVKGKQPVVSEYCNTKRSMTKDPGQPRKWCKPAEGIIKLNVDGSFDAATGVGGAGMVLRDEEGAVIFTACRYLPSCASPLEAELAACYDGVQLAREHADVECVVEMDCQEAICMITSQIEDRARNKEAFEA